MVLTSINVVIGHLSKEEANKYWKEISDVQEPSLNFEESYEACGGCMHLLQMALNMYLLTDGKHLPQFMSFVVNQRQEFTKASVSSK